MKISKVQANDIEKLKTDQKFFATFLKTNDNFLNKIVHSFKGIDSETFYDLKQEAACSLWHALSSYNPERKAKFITFAQTAIRNHVLYCVQQKQKKQNNDVSIEMFTRNNMSMDDEANYFELAWDTPHGDFENELIQKMDADRAMAKLSELDKKILHFKSQNLSQKEIADEMGMNIHTFKFYYYGEFIDKMQKIFGDEFKDLVRERNERRQSYVKPLRKRGRKPGVRTK